MAVCTMEWEVNYMHEAFQYPPQKRKTGLLSPACLMVGCNSCFSYQHDSIRYTLQNSEPYPSTQ